MVCCYLLALMSILSGTIAYNDSSKLKISFVFYFNSEIEILPVNLL